MGVYNIVCFPDGFIKPVLMKMYVTTTSFKKRHANVLT